MEAWSSATDLDTSGIVSQNTRKSETDGQSTDERFIAMAHSAILNYAGQN